MLRTRVLTAAWLAPLALGLIFGLPPRGLALALGLLLVLGASEYRRLSGLGQGGAGWFLVGLQALVFAGLLLADGRWLPQAPWVFAAVCAAWLPMLWRLRGFAPERGPDRTFRALGVVGALVSLTGAWLALVWLKYQDAGAWWILCLLLIVWSADIGAYFAGRAWGRRKLAPHLSPGKTVVGLAGGLVAAAVVGWAATRWLPTQAGGGLQWLLIASGVALVSAGGDLYISLHKRVTGVKDSGRIFPGHGGVLDRLDSLIAAAPFFALGLALAQGV